MFQKEQLDDNRLKVRDRGTRLPVFYFFCLSFESKKGAARRLVSTDVISSRRDLSIDVTVDWHILELTKLRCLPF